MRQQVKPAAVENQHVLFLPGVFNETLSLLFDAHQYFESRGPQEKSDIPTKYRAYYASEMSRITLRLTSVMAWLMVRRAIHAGRIEEEIATELYRLNAQDICVEKHPERLSMMPSYMVYLSERSFALYARIQRLDSEAYGVAA